ncbi:MBL fold metallo-hydrolase [Lentzea nigeriaca]|uniref:MBL fold metallo-hydrolase n=1 Tax=Lentzea nigeriaca TaxID=1128665 RepID=UPI0027DE299F|nr:MBL fold metallo-hydrolase [Lentzea nigeriaca]MBM7857155.1 cyclase [Lentzea nigeriaca]
MTSEPQLQELVPGVFAWIQPDGTWWINNAGAVHSGGEVVLVDTCATARRTRLFLDALDAATGGAPIRLAVNTHLHGDHVYGNALLPDETVIVAHERTRQGILQDFILANTPPAWSPTPEWGVDAVRAPTVSFRDEITLHAGGKPVVVRHPGYAAHTVGDAVAWLPEDGVLFTGDLVFHQVTPMIAMGSLDGALRSLDWLAGYEPSVVVPGHGPVVPGTAFAEVLDAHRRYYEFVARTAETGRDQGWTPLEAATHADLGEFADLPDAERLVLNLHRAYADADGVEINIAAALGDAIAYNGGPLSCAV